MREYVMRLIADDKWIKRSVFVLTGASAGFAYYYFIGCNSGACPISGNPYISTAYGAVMGMIISSTKNEPER
jgi:rhamnogalacturonyl hydrolase YesR